MTLRRTKVSQLWKVKTGTRLSLKLSEENMPDYLFQLAPLPALSTYPTLYKRSRIGNSQHISFFIRLSLIWYQLIDLCFTELVANEKFVTKKSKRRNQVSLDSNYGRGQEPRLPSTHLQFRFHHHPSQNIHIYCHDLKTTYINIF